MCMLVCGVRGRYSKHPKALTPAQTAIPGQCCRLLLYSVFSVLLATVPPPLPPPSFCIVILIVLILVWGETLAVLKAGTPLCETSLAGFICSRGWPRSLGIDALEVSEVQGSMPFLTCAALTVSPLSGSCWECYFECWKWLHLKVPNSIASP